MKVNLGDSRCIRMIKGGIMLAISIILVLIAVIISMWEDL